MNEIEKAQRIVAKLTEEDRIKLRQCIDEFDEAGKPEYFIEMKHHIIEFRNTLKLLEMEV